MACAAIGCLTAILEMKRQGTKTFAILLAFVPIPIASILLFGDMIKDLFFGERMILLEQGNLDLGERFNNVFGQVLFYWLKTSPLGNFTGYASGVGKAFNVRDLENAPAEVGAAMIVAEQGALGLLLFTLIAIIAMHFMLRRVLRSKKYWCLPLIATYASLFTLFYFKENSVLFPGLIGSLIFWSLPGLVAMFTAADPLSEGKGSKRTKLYQTAKRRSRFT